MDTDADAYDWEYGTDYSWDYGTDYSWDYSYDMGDPTYTSYMITDYGYGSDYDDDGCYLPADTD